ncbi:MAG TPA: superoxide dismutase family protein [Pseudonocardia sp.]|jgi:Cu-Zn family superoxide dismutase
MRRTHRPVAVATVAAAMLAVTACSNAQPSTRPTSSGPPPGSAGTNAGEVVVAAKFGADDAATNYDKALVPNGARMLVGEYIYDGSTTVVLNVRGLVPNRPYGAHAHAMPCGPKGDDAGPHFQHNADPVKPSVNPAFANARNEIWLDFTTDGQGNATVATTVPWVFSAKRPGSVVIHATATQTGPGVAGMAGARLACLSVGF